MWGKLASGQDKRPAFAGHGWSTIAPHVLAGLIAASIVCAISASAKASTPTAEQAGDTGARMAKRDQAARLRGARPLNIDPIASDATAELLRDKLAPAPEMLARWTLRNLVSKRALTGAA